jgi:hypothetical protein
MNSIASVRARMIARSYWFNASIILAHQDAGRPVVIAAHTGAADDPRAAGAPNQGSDAGRRVHGDAGEHQRRATARPVLRDLGGAGAIDDLDRSGSRALWVGRAQSTWAVAKPTSLCHQFDLRCRR